MEKEHQPDSMATITMKPEYPPSEVYSASEPPPAYRQRVSSSVQIARIAALTVVAASFILGSFILASSWVSARASCHQLEQLDAMLDKELALEGRSYGNDALMPDEPLPIANAHALHAAPPGVPEMSSMPVPQKPVVASPDSLLKEDPLNHAESKIDEDKLQKIDDVKVDTVNSGSDESSESDSSGEEDDDDLIRPMFKLPIQFDLDELAGAFLANNQKGRMNCVVERRHEEPLENKFPFNILGAFAPRAAPAERVAIICHGGDERAMPMFPDPQSQVFAFPLSGPVRLPLRPAPERTPERAPERAPERRPFAAPHRPAPFPLPMPWESSEEQANPREMRIHVQRVFAIPAPHNIPPRPENMGPFAPPPPPQDQNEREQEEMSAPRQMRVIAIPAPHNMPPAPENMGPFQPPPPPQHQGQNEQQAVLHQFVPQSAPTQEMEPEVQKMQMEGSPVQMNLPWDLTPEDLHMIHRTAQEAVASQRRDQQIDNDMQEVKTIVNSLAAAEVEAEQAEQAQQAQAPRAPRTLLLPQDMPVDQRPHYMQPRSVRSVDAPHEREKRVKRCACSCA
ncbi:WAS/WASL-interacting protein family member 3 isoform X2 [Nymphalis io]|uniref:WAS/WASL-interacting protein family member 3 isoform X2 n=1 Tax=Inachis io TaxID=171585 RepID=UPI0021670897|nr:WAS/WASL-interacting protein family member 3 isoform X2 [Nymphalis io]